MVVLGGFLIAAAILCDIGTVEHHQTGVWRTSAQPEPAEAVTVRTVQQMAAA